jgi:hypothetical protein
MALAAIVAAATFQSARANSATWDETLYLYLGRHAVITHADYAAFASLGVAPLPVRLIWTPRVIGPTASEPSDPAVYRQRVDRARLNAIAWFAVPLVLAVLVLVSSAYGVAAGAVAAVLIALSPNVIAHASLATTDVAFACMFIVSTAAAIAYLRRRSGPAPSALAAAMGLALATKYSAIGLYLILVTMLAVRWRERRWFRDLTVMIGSLVIAWALHGWQVAPLMTPTGVAASMVQAVFGWTGRATGIVTWLAALPAPIFLRGIAAQAFLERGGQEAFLLGAVSQHGWWYYFPVALAMKSTLIELAALVTFVALAFVRKLRDVETQVVVTTVVVFGLLALMGRRDLGVRYVLPVVILVVIAAAAWAADVLRGFKWAPAIGVAAVSMQAFSLLTIAPQHLAYFNVLAGGPERGYTRLVDSNLDWGQDLLRLNEWLAPQPDVEVGLAYFGSAPPLAYGIQSADWRSLQPSGPGRRKFFVISATYLQGIFLCEDPFASFRALAPSARIGYTLMAYDVARDDVRRALAVAAGDRCAP